MPRLCIVHTVQSLQLHWRTLTEHNLSQSCSSKMFMIEVPTTCPCINQASNQMSQESKILLEAKAVYEAVGITSVANFKPAAASTSGQVGTSVLN